MKSYVVVDVFREIVEKVSAEMLTELQVLDAKITGVHYEHGHPLEIIETLAQKDTTGAHRFSKYPLIALFQDFPETITDKTGLQSEVNLHIIIAKATLPTYKANERYENNLKPYLYPIYASLFKQINSHKATLTKAPGLIAHTKTDRIFWGRQGLYKNEKNIFNDWLDCIEIKDLKLKINLKNC